MNSQPSQALSSLFSLVDFDAIGRESGFIKRRSRKLSACGFFLMMLNSLVLGIGSFNRLASVLGWIEPDSMSRQGLARRFTTRSTVMLTKVRDGLIEAQDRLSLNMVLGGPIKRVLVEDSTVFSMHPGNAVHFRATGNQRQAGAGGKVNLVYDLIGGRVVGLTHRQACEPDQGFSLEILRCVREGDLVLRDRGYFSLEAIEGIGKAGAFWITRLPSTVNVSAPDGRSFETILRETPGDEIEMEVLVGASLRLPCRLIAKRYDERTAEKNRREKRQVSMDHGKTPSEASLLQAQWNILLTNIPAEATKADELFTLYRWRWQIEIVFRGLKQSLKHREVFSRKTGRYRLEATVLAVTIFALLALIQSAKLRKTMKRPLQLSLERVTQWLAIAISTARNVAENATKSYRRDYDPRHLRHGQRERQTLGKSVLKVCKSIF
jgi:hypothetical protein